MKGFALLNSSCFLYLKVFINIFAKLKKEIYYVPFLNKNGKFYNGLKIVYYNLKTGQNFKKNLKILRNLV